MSLVTLEEKSPGVVVLTLNDPATRNAMSKEMAAEFVVAISRLRNMPSARVAVLTGAGQAFSGGGHLEMLFEKTKLSQSENQQQMEQFYREFLSLVDLDIPIVAAINGHAIGAGMCLALACDLRIAAVGAKLGLNFVCLGLHPGMGATYFLPRIIGPAKANELLLAGRIISAQEAGELGVVNRVVEADKLNLAVEEFCQEVVASGPQAIKALKQSLRLSPQSSLNQCLQREAQCQALDYQHPEFLEGITAAKEKRKPKF